MKIALISASWHSDLVTAAKTSCLEQLRSHGVETESCVDGFTVPGSLEIPLFAAKLAQTKKYSGIIAFGLIVDGGIYRHEFVAQAVLNGIVRVQLDTGVPVFSCILTPQAFHEHADHLRFFREHLATKGREAADTAVNFMGLLAATDFNPQAAG